MHVHLPIRQSRHYDGSGRRYVAPECSCGALWSPCPTCGVTSWDSEPCPCDNDPYRAMLIELSEGDEITLRQVTAELLGSAGSLAEAVKRHAEEVSTVMASVPTYDIARCIRDHYSGAAMLRSRIEEALRAALAPLVHRDVLALRAERAIPTLPAADVQLHPEAA